MTPHSPSPTPLRPFSRLRSSRGFTLLEIIVVLGIIILLLTLVIPMYWKSKDNVKTVACLNNLKQIGTALNLYLADHDLTVPKLVSARKSLSENVPAIDTVLEPYVKDKAVFACPADKKFARITGTSYFWNSALNGQKLGSLDFLRITQDQTHIPLLSDKEGFHPFQENKVNVLYADGHAAKELSFSSER